MEAIKYIKRVEIKNLWGEHDIVWDLNQDVNVLAGINGSGKSTILNLIVRTVLGEYDKAITNMINMVVIVFNNNQNISYMSSYGYNSLLKKLVNTDFENDFKTRMKEGATEVIEDFIEGRDISSLNKIGDFMGGMYLFNHEPIPKENLKQILNIDFIKTFDQKFQIKEIVDRSVEEGVKTELDLQISFLHKLYLNYQIDIGKRAITALTSKDDKIKSNVNYKFNLFLDTIDFLFKETGKRVDRNSNQLTFLKGEKKITPYMLSSGEKQIVIILMTALVQDEKPFVMFMDEPEISLHTDWQEKLIENVRKLNENVQLIIATHSPSIIVDGWLDKVTEVSEITINSEKVEL